MSDEMKKAGDTWARLTLERVHAREAWAHEPTRANAAPAYLADELAAAAETSWRIAAENRRVELCAQAVADNKRIADALEKLVAIMVKP